MGPKGCPEMSAKNYYYTLCNSPEERRSQLFFCALFQTRKKEAQLKYHNFLSAGKLLVKYPPKFELRGDWSHEMGG